MGPKTGEPTVEDNRPRNIDIPSVISYDLPLPGITSILHRISGAAIFFAIPFLLWGLGQSLDSPESFAGVKEVLGGFLPKLILWAIVAGLIFHFVAGIKHLLMDLGIGETLESVNIAAKLVIVVSAVLIALAGYWIW